MLAAEALGESIEELQEKLEEYKNQLVQVEEALALQPGDDTLTTLRNDLNELIKISEEFCNSAGSSSASRASAATNSGGSVLSSKGSGAALGGSGNNGCADTEAAVGEAVVTSPPNKAHHHHYELIPASAATQTLVGRTCDAPYNGKWCTAVIRMVRTASTGHEKCVVQYVGYNSKYEFRLSEVNVLKPPHPAQCQPGTIVQAIWPEDGEWYDARVEEQTEAGYRVVFVHPNHNAVLVPANSALGSAAGKLGGGGSTSSSSNSSASGSEEMVVATAEVKFDQVRIKTQKSKDYAGVGGGGGPGASGGSGGGGGGVSSDGKRKVAELVTPGGWRIPENLAIKPGDTEQEKKLKRKKIHSIKSRQRQEQTDQAAQDKKLGWQKFQKKSSQKSASLVTKKGKESIFKSPESIEGKVGVTGSGNAMTDFPQRERMYIHGGGGATNQQEDGAATEHRME
eukprot:Filipodium_phascolosomae@DN2052_c0_g1_i1.p1